VSADANNLMSAKFQLKSRVKRHVSTVDVGLPRQWAEIRLWAKKNWLCCRVLNCQMEY
jgi:hypothetical protein